MPNTGEAAAALMDAMRRGRLDLGSPPCVRSGPDAREASRT